MKAEAAYIPDGTRKPTVVFCTGRVGAVLYQENVLLPGELQNWSEEDFITTMRTGVTPSGRQLDPEFMPWKEFGQLGEEELKGIWLYLSSLPQP